MSNFKKFKEAVRMQFDSMLDKELFVTGATKDELWDKYLSSFPEGTNEIFRERQSHDCQHCKQFIRAMGDVVSITEKNTLISIWDIDPTGVDPEYVVVAKALSKLVKSKAIDNILLSYEKKRGVDFNHQQLGNNDILTWHHFYCELPDRFVCSYDDIGGKLSDTAARKQVFRRSLESITMDAIETVIDLIAQDSIYKGAEFAPIVGKLHIYKKKYNKIAAKLKDNFCWNELSGAGAVAKIRNSAIGTLLNNISDGMELDMAVGKYEAVVAPTNYKRPKAVFTKKMIEQAQKDITDMGYINSLGRRHTVIDDITVNDIIFVDKVSRHKLTRDVFADLADEVHISAKHLGKVEEISIENFIKDIIPNISVMELLMENSHRGNLMSLISPKDPKAPSMFKWENNFSWAYNGDIADSMKERVKSAGGNVEGVLRFSIQWNDGDNNQNDFDAHCIEPNGNHIYFIHNKKPDISRTTGQLDVDVIHPGAKVAVENITWTDINKMLEGEYGFHVHNYSHNGGRTGFTAEIEYDGVIHSYSYAKELRQDENVQVAKIKFSRENGIQFIESLDSTQSSKDIWRIRTQQFTPVSIMMFSPNHWVNSSGIGNKHYFFMLDKCVNELQPRGFFNEFLKEDLSKRHRKVFEALGSKMKVELSDTQLSGLGFSSTQRNSIVCRVSGSFTRTLKIKF